MFRASGQVDRVAQTCPCVLQADGFGIIPVAAGELQIDCAGDVGCVREFFKGGRSNCIGRLRTLRESACRVARDSVGSSGAFVHACTSMHSARSLPARHHRSSNASSISW